MLLHSILIIQVKLSKVLKPLENVIYIYYFFFLILLLNLKKKIFLIYLAL